MEQQEVKRQPTQAASTSIDPGTHIGLVTLRVADLGRSLSFYEGVLGFRAIERAAGRATLGAQDGVPLLELREVQGAPPPGQLRKCGRSSSTCSGDASPSTIADNTGSQRAHSAPDSMHS